MPARVTEAFHDIKRRIANNPDYGWSVASSYAHIGLNIIVQILLVPLYLHHLGKAEFGVLMIMLAAVNYLGLGIGWMSSGAQRIMGELAAHNNHEALERTYGLSKIIFFVYATLTSSLAFAVVWAFRGQLFPDTPALGAQTVSMVALGVVYVIALYDLNVDRLVLISIGKQAWANLLSVISLVVFALAVMPILSGEGGLMGVIAALLCGVLVARIVSFLLMQRQGLHLRWPGAHGRTILSRLIGPMGMGYAVYGALLLTLLQADTLILGVLGGPLLVADFILVWKIADVTMQALWRLPESLVPYLIQMDARGEHERMRTIYASAQKGMLILATAAAIGFGMFGQSVVALWVGWEHTPNLPWAYPLAGGAMFWMVIARLPAIYAFSTVRLSPLVFVTAVETVGKVILLFALFPALGLYAPLIAVNVVHLLGVAYLYQRLYRQSMSTPESETA
ncbi:MAG: hypothetical protein NUV50_11045 [Rhodospirillales bacterium]|nr:hypothetical protein [Rhodospirillales bacterium]